MFDELERLCAVKGLLELLVYYAERGAADRQAWQDRLAHVEGATGRDLVHVSADLGRTGPGGDAGDGAPDHPGNWSASASTRH